MMEKILQMISSAMVWFLIKVNRLSAEPKENNTKYIRQGPREFVSYEYSEVTLKNIKRACKVH